MFTGGHGKVALQPSGGSCSIKVRSFPKLVLMLLLLCTEHLDNQKSCLWYFAQVHWMARRCRLHKGSSSGEVFPWCQNWVRISTNAFSNRWLHQHTPFHSLLWCVDPFMRARPIFNYRPLPSLSNRSVPSSSCYVESMLLQTLEPQLTFESSVVNSNTCQMRLLYFWRSGDNAWPPSRVACRKRDTGVVILLLNVQVRHVAVSLEWRHLH